MTKNKEIEEIKTTLKYLAKQFAIFGSVGAINTLFSLSIILALTELEKVNYLLANMIGYTAGILLGFLLHKKITFRKYPSPGIIRQFQAFLTVFVIAYTAQFYLLYLLVDKLHIDPTQGQIIAWVAFILSSFAGNRMITFQKPKTTKQKKKQTKVKAKTNKKAAPKAKRKPAKA